MIHVRRHWLSDLAQLSVRYVNTAEKPRAYQHKINTATGQHLTVHTYTHCNILFFLHNGTLLKRHHTVPGNGVTGMANVIR